MTIFDCALSPDGAQLAAVDSNSRLSVFNLPDVLAWSDRNDDPVNTTAPLRIDTESGRLYAVTFADQVIITGGDQCISVYNASLPDDQYRVMQLVNPQVVMGSSGRMPVSETNGLAYCSASGALYSASGQNEAFQWDLVTGNLVTTMKGHSDYLHCVHLVSPMIIITGSEDGTARLWDTRTADSQATFDPPPTQKGARRWISSLACNGDLMSMASGAGQLATFHVPSRALLQCTTTRPILSVNYCDQQLVSGGHEPFLTAWDSDGTERVHVSCPTASIYSIQVYPDASARVRMACCGTDNTLALFADPNLPPSIKLGM